jgi:hypothetical protein
MGVREVRLELRLAGRAPIRVGTEFSIRGERGRFSFRRYEVPTDGKPAWVTAWGGPSGRESWRSFDPNRITRIYRTRTISTRPEGSIR